MAMRVLAWQPEIRLENAGPARALLLGGFGASAAVLRPLAVRLRQAGYAVEVAALARHTGDAASFERSRTWHYYRDALLRLRAAATGRPRPLLLGGYSTGGLIAVLLAARHPELVDGLVLLSPVLRAARLRTQVVGYSFGSLYYVGLPAAALATCLALVVRGRRRQWPLHGVAWRTLASGAIFAAAALGLRNVTVPLRSGGPMEHEGEPVLPPHFARASLVTGSTLVPLQLLARARLGSLTVPTCVVFGEADDVVDVDYGVRLVSRIERAGVEVHVIANAPHRVVVVPACLDIVERFARHLADAAALTIDPARTAPAR